MRPIETIARKILADSPMNPIPGTRAMAAYWHAYDSALWYACRDKRVCATLPAEVMDIVKRVEAAALSACPQAHADAVVGLLELGYLSGDGLAMRDAASGTYFKAYMPAEGDVCFDAGAHCGFVSRQLCELAGRTGKVYAVEPHPRNCMQLERRIKGAGVGAGVVIVQGALGAEQGKAMLSESLGSCSHRLADLGTHRYEVTVDTIDAFELPRLDFLKVDVEGSEWAVMRGARETVKRCRPHVAIEWEGADNRHNLTCYFDAAGYETEIETVPDGSVGMIWATPKEKKL